MRNRFAGPSARPPIPYRREWITSSPGPQLPDISLFLSAEQAAFTRIVRTLADDRPIAEVLGLVVAELAQLSGARGIEIVRFGGPDGTVVVSSTIERGADDTEASGLAAEVRRSGRPAERPPGAGEAAAAVPIHAVDRLWGALAATAPPVAGEVAIECLERFSELVGVAITHSEIRTRLEAQASTDDLTGLVNRREFAARLREASAQAGRYATPLSLAILDLDGFKLVNDVHGHASGDLVLREVGRRLGGLTRAGETLARIGGEEFAWILPATSGPEAYQAAERARRAVADSPLAGVAGLTISAGVAELEAAAGDPDSLFRLADGALYRAKADGRNATRLATGGEPDRRPATPRPPRRSQVGSALRVLADAVDSLGPGTPRHSERVASLAVRIALELGWTAGDVARLRAAALLHDVGKVTVERRVLTAPGPLDPGQVNQIRHHAAAGARLAAMSLDDEQVSWIRHHHERPDGRGYPDGLAHDAIPEGAAIIAVAEAVDCMTGGGPGGSARSEEEALAECRRESGRAFSQPVVDAVEQVLRGRGPDDVRDAVSGSPLAPPA